jgi:hypothetical protein
MSPLKQRKTKYLVVFDGSYKQLVYFVTHQTQWEVLRKKITS